MYKTIPDAVTAALQRFPATTMLEYDTDADGNPRPIACKGYGADWMRTFQILQDRGGWIIDYGQDA